MITQRSAQQQPIDIYADNPICTLDYMIAVLQAAKNGNKVEFRSFVIGRPNSSWNLNPPLVGYDWIHYQYRISPNSRPKKTVPMGRDDYPPFFWLKCPHSGMHKLPLAVGCDGIRVEMGEAIITICWATIINWKWQYSTDRKTWLPCTKEVSA